MIVIKNGRVIDPKNKLDEITDVAIKDNKIFSIGKINDYSKYKKIIDAENMIVAPGLIDIHVHFRDPGFTDKEDILSGAESASKGGYTTVICMANTKPIVDSKETLEYIINKSKQASINVLTTSAVTKGFRGEELTDMEELKNLGAVGFTDDGIPIKNSKIVKKAMIKAKKLNVPISFHEEDPELVNGSGVNEGKISKALNIKGASSVSEYSIIARDCMLALDTKAKINIQHISAGESVEVVRFAKKMGADVHAEVTPNHFSLTEDIVLEKKSLAKVNPPIRTSKDRRKIIEGLQDNTIDIIATDHAPHTNLEKSKPIQEAPSGIIGLETALALGITNLVNKNHITMIELLEKMTINPANLYNLEKGHISVGANADIVIFDDKESFVVDKFASKSNNSPFIGQALFGKIKYTICNGKIVYSD